MLPQRTKIALTATLIAGIPLVGAALLLIAQVNLKQAFLRIARFVVGGVKDDVAIVAAVSIMLLAVVWLVIITRALCEARSDRKTAPATERHASETITGR